jgi:hypothetical protein
MAATPRVGSRWLVLGVVTAATVLAAPGCSCGTELGEPDGGGTDGGGTDGGSDGGPPDAGEVCLSAVDLGGLTFDGLDAGSTGIPRDQFLAAYALAYCDALARCYPFDRSLVGDCAATLPDASWIPSPICNQAPGSVSCRATLFDLSSLRARLQAPAGVGYDPAQAASCLARPWPCGDQSDQAVVPRACDRVLRPLVTDGGACELDGQCISGTCTRANPGLSCGGSCAPGDVPPEEIYLGSRCGEDGGCGADGGLVCDGLTCRRAAGAGAPCGANMDCGPGLVCPMSSFRCTTPVPRGGACADDFMLLASGSLGPGTSWFEGQCEPGSLCVGEQAQPDGGVSPGTCQPPSRAGEPCVAGDRTGRVHETGCVLGLVCSCGVCAPAPLSGACGNGWVPCRPHQAACDVDGVCRPVSSFSHCYFGQQCASGYCDMLLNACSTPPAAGFCPG